MAIFHLLSREVRPMMRLATLASFLLGLYLLTGCGGGTKSSTPGKPGPAPKTDPEVKKTEPKENGTTTPVEKAENAEMEAAIKDLGGKVNRDTKGKGKPITGVSLSGTKADDSDLKTLVPQLDKVV